MQNPTRWLLPVAVLGAGTFMYFRNSAHTEAGAAARADVPGVPVTVAAVESRTVPVNLQAIGNVEPYATVSVKARVDGQIIAVHFREGQEVAQGAPLFEIDPRPFEAALHQAQANLQRDRALLDNARTIVARDTDLHAKKYITDDTYDQARTNAQTAEAVVKADEAAVENARLNFEYCSIRSPLNGYAGRIMIQAGNLVKANDANPLVVLNQVRPVYVSFTVPEKSLTEIRRLQRDNALKVVAAVEGAAAPAEGEVSFIDNAADPATGTIRLKARFANNDRALWPGQFVNLSLTLRAQANALVVPTVAVQNGPNGAYVYLVKADRSVELRPVSVDRAEGQQSVIAQGLAAGDTVVVTGQLRLAAGVKVAPAAAPGPAAAQ